MGGGQSKDSKRRESFQKKNLKSQSKEDDVFKSSDSSFRCSSDSGSSDQELRENVLALTNDTDMLNNMAAIENDVQLPSTSKLSNEINPIGFKARDYSGIAGFNSKHKMENKGGKNNTLIGMQYVTHVHDKKDQLTEKLELTFAAIQSSFKRIYHPESDEYNHLHGIQPPWVPEHVLIFDECVVDIDIEADHNWLGRPSEVSSVELNHLLNFGSDKDNPIPKRLKLKGSAGFGKSTICTILTRQWAIDHPGFVSNFDLTIRYNLRDLPSRVQSVEEELARFCHSISAVPGDLNLTKKTLKRFSDKILIVLDGYDEATVPQRKLVDFLVASRGFNHIFGQSTLLVTAADLDGDFLTECDRVARIPALGWNYPKCRHYIETYFMYDLLKASALTKKLDAKNKLFMSGLSPFLLSIICFLHSKDIIPKLKSEFGIFEALAKYLLGDGPDVEALLIKTGQFFYQLLKEGKTAFTPDEMIDVLGQENFRLVANSQLIRETTSWEYGGQRRKSLKEYEAFHQLFATFFATKFLKVKFEGLRTKEERTRFLCQLAKQNDFHLTVVAMRDSDKTALLFHSEFSGGVVFRWDIASGTPIEDISGSVEMSGDNRDVFVYQLPSVIAVLENGMYNGFKYAEEFFPQRMEGSRAISFLAENLSLHQFPVFYYHEYYRQNEGDLFSIDGRCVEDGKVLWKGHVFCYRRLPIEKMPIIDVWSRNDRDDDANGIRHIYFKRFVIKVSFKRVSKEDSNWLEHLVREYLQCNLTLPLCNGDNLRSGLYAWELVHCLRKSRLPFSYWRILMNEYAGVLMFQPIERPVLNFLVSPDRLIINRSNGELVDRKIPYENLYQTEVELKEKLSFDHLNLSMQISGMMAPEAEDSSDEE